MTFIHKENVSKRWWVTGIPIIDILYMPYTLMAIGYIVIGGLLNSQPDYGVLIALMIDWFFGVGILSHAIDEMKGHPLNTGFSDKQLKSLALFGFLGTLVIANYIAYYKSVIFLPIYLFLLIVVALYNAELFNGRFHRDMFFTFAFALLPMLIAYYMMNLTLPTIADLFFIAGISATSSIETVVNHFVKFNSKDFHTAYDRNFAYLQRSVWATVWIVYFIAMYFILKQF